MITWLTGFCEEHLKLSLPQPLLLVFRWLHSSDRSVPSFRSNGQAIKNVSLLLMQFSTLSACRRSLIFGTISGRKVTWQSHDDVIGRSLQRLLRTICTQAVMLLFRAIEIKQETVIIICYSRYSLRGCTNHSRWLFFTLLKKL